MGRQEDHTRRALDEIECFERLSTSLQPPAQGWRLTMAFYAGLHLVDAFLHMKRGAGTGGRIPQEFEAHWERWQAIKACPEIRDNVRRAYRDLQDMSEQQRYDPGFRFDGRMLARSAQHLDTLKSFFAPKLGIVAPAR